MTPLSSPAELMSAFADGELHDDELAAVWLALAESQSVVSEWDRCHLIGDVLRSSIDSVSSLPASADSASFINRLNLKLRSEACFASAEVVLPEWPRSPREPNMLSPAEQQLHHGSAANDGVFRWKLLAGFATLSAVSVITWTAVGPTSTSTNSPQLAQRQEATQILVSSPQGAIVRDARLNELLAAHKQLGATSALQAPSGFLQSATFEIAPGNGR